MHNSVCGYCKKCEKYYEVSGHFVLEQSFAYCPDCNSVLSIIYEPMITIRRELALSPSEIGGKAIVK